MENEFNFAKAARAVSVNSKAADRTAIKVGLSIYMTALPRLMTRNLSVSFPSPSSRWSAGRSPYLCAVKCREAFKVVGSSLYFVVVNDQIPTVT